MNKILIIGKDYYPDKLGVSKYTTEMAEWLGENDRDVDVITGHPYYPDWKYKGKNSSYFYVKELINNIKVFRVPLYIPAKPHGLGRSIQNISFAIFSLPLMFYFFIIKRPFVVISLVPSYANSFFAVILGKIFNIKTIIHVQDLEFDLAEKLNLLPAIGWKLLFQIERFTLTHASLISSISIRMLNELTAKIKVNIPTVLFPNWVDKKSIYPDRKNGNLYRSSFDISTSDFVILYSGNIGYKQGFNTIIDIAQKMKDNNKVKILIVGTGAGDKDLKNIIHKNKLKNIYHSFPVEDKMLNMLLNIADLHIVLQKEGIDNYILPSKITNIFGVGGYIFVTGSDDSEISDLVNDYPGIMYIINNDELDNCINKINKMVLNRNNHIINNVALEYAKKSLDKEKILSDFSNYLS